MLQLTRVGHPLFGGVLLNHSGPLPGLSDPVCKCGNRLEEGEISRRPYVQPFTCALVCVKQGTVSTFGSFDVASCSKASTLLQSTTMSYIF